jgi:enoyl-CoA hydratase/carnithine racemase
MKGAAHTPRHFLWQMRGAVAVITLNRPEKKNPLTFESYAELRDSFRGLAACDDVKAVVLTGAGGNFCSGGDVREIIGPLTEMDMDGLLDFTRMTGDLVKAMRDCPQPVIAAVDGACAGAGAILAMASDAILPRLIGQGRAAELLFTGRAMSAEEGERWGFYNRLCGAGELLDEAVAMAGKLAEGPNFAHMMTKTMLNREWDMSLEAAIEAEAQAQAICMGTRDFRTAFEAFMAKGKPVFEGK